ncbi:MAG TPA: hypothetical protein VFY65_16390 [Longimicrobium sp.]|nr:hypothetical protein [Longimicrobium sp.]
MRSVYWRAAVCGVALATAAACDDEGTGPGGGGGEEGGGGGGLTAPASMDRFEVQVRAGGAFRPGQPIQITVTGKANLRTGDAVVQLVLPEVAAARRAGWERLDYGHDGDAEPEFADRQSIGRGQSLTRTASITIPRPGYYQVVATIRQRAEDATDEQPADGELVQNVAHDEIWIYVAENGGRATDTFEPARIPESMHRVPGPLTPLTQAPPGTVDEPANTGPRTSRAPAGSPRHTHAPYAGYVDLHAMYWNNDVSALRPIPNARYEYLIYNRLGTFIRSSPGTTDASGLTFVECYSDANGYGQYKLRVYLDSDRVTMQEQLAIDTPVRDFATTCGTAGNEQPLAGTLPKERSHVYANLDRGIRNGDAFFGLRRADITVALSSTHSYSTYEWHSTARRLIIATNPAPGFGGQIWGTFGAFVHVHEYGHAYQEDVLGGVKRYYYINGGTTPVCPQNHPMQNQTNLQCALAEGFADYYAVSALPGATGVVETEMESGRYSPSATNQWSYGVGSNGSIIQGAVASFLYDITDPANETHDQTAYPGTYVAEVIRTCQVWTGSWKYNDGIDHLAYCFVGTITDTQYFNTRSPHPTSHSTTAPEPEPYNTRYFKIRKNSMKNLFGYTV